MTVLITTIIIIAAVMIAIFMYSILASISKSKTAYEKDMDDQEQIDYLRSRKKKAAVK